MRMRAMLRVMNTVPESKPTVPTTNWNWFVILSSPVNRSDRVEYRNEVASTDAQHNNKQRRTTPVNRFACVLHMTGEGIRVVVCSNLKDNCGIPQYELKDRRDTCGGAKDQEGAQEEEGRENERAHMDKNSGTASDAARVPKD
jgi:hypothetical protein